MPDDHTHDPDGASREHPHARGFRLKKRIGLAVATGGGLAAASHLGGGLVIVHVGLPILVGVATWLGVAIWQWAGVVVVGLLVIAVVLYVRIRSKLTKSDKESTP